jgi:hypothetical protein
VSVLDNGLCCAGGLRPNLHEIAASKRTAEIEGVDVTFGNVPAIRTSSLVKEVRCSGPFGGEVHLGRSMVTPAQQR